MYKIFHDCTGYNVSQRFSLTNEHCILRAMVDDFSFRDEGANIILSRIDSTSEKTSSCSLGKVPGGREGERKREVEGERKRGGGREREKRERTL